jgi:hypothetical protein
MLPVCISMVATGTFVITNYPPEHLQSRAALLRENTRHFRRRRSSFCCIWAKKSMNDFLFLYERFPALRGLLPLHAIFAP